MGARTHRWLRVAGGGHEAAGAALITIAADDLDLASGLLLLLERALDDLPEGAELEIESREPSVAHDLPAWCHAHLRRRRLLEAAQRERHFRDARAGSVMAPTSDALKDFLGKAVLGLPLF